jgi:hypothetical protein
MLQPTFWTSEGRPVNTGILDPLCSGNPAAPFAATTLMALIDGARISGMVRIEVRGSGMQQVELLPASADAPSLGVFILSSDGTFAWLDFDTVNLGQGLQDIRIIAFSVSAGQPGRREIIAMPASQWNPGHT